MPGPNYPTYVSVQQLKAIAGSGGNSANLEKYCDGLNRTLDNFNINTKLRICHFIAQVMHESGGFRWMREIWGPTKAQRGYEGRRDLGNTQPGDGKRFMGRGPIQLTGRSNYRQFTQDVGIDHGIDFESHPWVVEDDPWAMMAAGWYWDSRNLNSKADQDNVDLVTKAINGGYNGLEDRKKYLARAKQQIQEPKALPVAKTFTVTQKTVFKKQPIQSNKLDGELKSTIESGEFGILAMAFKDGHYYITLDTELEVDGSSKKYNTWYIWPDHISFNGQSKSGYPNLDVPHLSQRDNERRPWGTCNVTCVAMVLKFFGIKNPFPGIQFEDGLYDYVVQKWGDRKFIQHHNVLSQLLVEFGKAKGITNQFSTTTPWSEVKAHLDAGNPVILSGKFTGSGHILVLRGYDDKGFWVNDPWGEWFPTGYQAKSGENLHYSYKLMNRVSYGGSLSTWAHLPKAA